MNPNTQELIDCICDDIIPGPGTCMDFGIPEDGDPTEVFGALQWAFKRGTATREEFGDARRNGPKLTEIANRTWDGRQNPYACTIRTGWDS